MAPQSTRCSWCGRTVEPDEGWRVRESPGARVAAFCRLEHVVPWSIQGAPWEAGELDGPDAEGVDSCARCGERLGEVRVTVVRHRGAHRIPDAFCSVDHLAEWAKAGGRWR
jgi:recombinational DNA repair protein (RecF pathway)